MSAPTRDGARAAGDAPAPGGSSSAAAPTRTADTTLILLPAGARDRVSRFLLARPGLPAALGALAVLAFFLVVAPSFRTGAGIANVLDTSAQPCGAADCLAAVQAGTNVSYQGATGLTEFDENGDPTSSTFVIWQFAADGIKTVQTLESGE